LRNINRQKLHFLKAFKSGTLDAPEAKKTAAKNSPFAVPNSEAKCHSARLLFWPTLGGD